jgi:hypothetical protein
LRQGMDGPHSGPAASGLPPASALGLLPSRALSSGQATRPYRGRGAGWSHVRGWVVPCSWPGWSHVRGRGGPLLVAVDRADGPGDGPAAAPAGGAPGRAGRRGGLTRPGVGWSGALGRSAHGLAWGAPRIGVGGPRIGVGTPTIQGGHPHGLGWVDHGLGWWAPRFGVSDPRFRVASPTVWGGVVAGGECLSQRHREGGCHGEASGRGLWRGVPQTRSREGVGVARLLGGLCMGG